MSVTINNNDLKQPLRFLRIGIYLLVFLTLAHCQKDELNQDVQKTIETVSFSEAIELINASSPSISNRSSEEPFVTLDL